VSFRAVCGGAAARDDALVGTFLCDPRLNIASVTGEIIERLDCLPAELQGQGWHPFVEPADFDVTRTMGLDLHTGRGGVYDLRARARTGDPILYLQIRTLIIRTGSQPSLVRGVIDLRYSERRRAFCFGTQRGHQR
jgi:hypothetical protein